MPMHDTPAEHQADDNTERLFLGSVLKVGKLPPLSQPLREESLTGERNRIVLRVMRAMQASHEWIDVDGLADRLRNDARGAFFTGWRQYLAGSQTIEQEHASGSSAAALRELIRRQDGEPPKQPAQDQPAKREQLTPPDEAQEQPAEQDEPVEADESIDPDEPVAGDEREWDFDPLKRYVIHSAAEALKPHPPLEWLVDKIISRGSVSIFYGEPGSKKTYSMLWLAVCAALGKDWLGFATRACRVLFVDEESGETRLGQRIAQTLHGALTGESTPLEYISLAGLHLNDAQDVGRLHGWIRGHHSELVIIDSLAAITSGDENSKQEVQPVMTALRSVAEATGAAIVLIHHSGKNGVYRGSSAYKASTDLLVHVTSQDGSQFVDFKTEKNRDGLAMTWAARAVWVAKEDPLHNQFYMESMQVSGAGKTPGPTRQFIIHYMEEHGECTRAEVVTAALAAKVGTQDSVYQAMHDLVKSGQIRRTNPDQRGRGTVARYALEGTKALDIAEEIEEDMEDLGVSVSPP